jgi:hypothetical protein
MQLVPIATISLASGSVSFGGTSFIFSVLRLDQSRALLPQLPLPESPFGRWHSDRKAKLSNARQTGLYLND